MSKKQLLLLLCITTLLLSCKKELTSSGGKKKDNKLEVRNFDFDYLKGKAKVNYLDNNERQNAKANFRIKKDSIIWVQFSGVGGIEGGRILITKDSVVMIDRINKEIHAFHYDELTDRYKFEIDYELIESMILGNMPFQVDRKDKVSRQPDFFLVKQKYALSTIENYVNRNTQKLEKLVIEQDVTRNSLNLDYKKFNTINESLFPFTSSVTLKYNNKNKTLFTEINLDFSRAEIPDKPLKFPFNIPVKYERK